jgi:RNA polymerase sigma-70 factor (ECF subfamily)
MVPSASTALRVLPANSNSYEDLYLGQHSRIVRLCRTILADPDEADEVAQEVFMKALRQHRSGDYPRSWNAWLTRVAVNACRDRQRSWWWKWSRRSVDLDDIQLPTRETPEEISSNREQVARIWNLFRKLPPRQREVFALRHIEGWSTEEVAKTLNLSPGSVKLHLFRAVHALRSAIGGES